MKKRIFIAANLPAETKELLAEFMARAKKANKDASIKWSVKDNLHLTLHFLGYLDEGELELAAKAAAKAAASCGQKSLGLEIGQAGGFPSLMKPRIVFVSVKGNGVSILAGLQKILGRELEKTGFEIEKRPWKAHITLGRVKDLKRDMKIPGGTPEGEKFRISSIDSMESRLSPKGPKYGVLARYSLK